MNSIKFFKVTSLPAVLEPNSMYLVNTAGILNVHISDNTGTNSLQLSSNNNGSDLIPYPIKKDTPKIVGDNNSYPLTTLGLVTRRLYMIPFTVPRSLTLTNLRISVTTQSNNNTASIGIYNNINIANGNDNPYQLLASVNNISTQGTGNKDASINFTFSPNTLYWIGFMASGSPTLRAVHGYSIASSLGRLVSSNSAVTHLYKNYGTFGLPALAPTDFLSGIDRIPAVYLVE